MGFWGIWIKPSCEWLQFWKNRAFGLIILQVIFLLGLGLGSGLWNWDFWDFRLVDGWQRARVFLKKHFSQDFSDPVTLVWIDQVTLNQLGKTQLMGEDWDIAFKRLKLGRPRHVWILRDPSEDSAFREWLAKAPSWVTGYTPQLDEKWRKVIYGPLELKLWVAVKTVDKALFAKDGVTRRGLIRFQREPLGYAKAVQIFSQNLDEKRWFKLFESDQIWVTYESPIYWQSLKWENLIQQDVDLWKHLVKDRLLIIGFDLGLSLRDYVQTSLEYREGIIPEAYFHASVVDNLIKNKNWTWLPKAWVDGLVWLSLAVVLGVGVKWSLMTQTLVALGLIAVIATVQLGFLAPLGYWGNWARLIFVLIGGVYLQLPLRLYLETERRKQTQKQNEDLKQVERLKTAFFGLMSHNIKTPLARLSAMLDLLKERHPPTAETQEIWGYLNQSLKELFHLVDWAISYLKVESHNLRLQKEWITVSELVSLLKAKYDHLAQASKVTVNVDFVPDLKIYVDKGVLLQALGNILENGIKYSRPHSRVRIWFTFQTGYLVWIFEDNGPGLEPHEVQQVFEKFFRGSNATEMGVKGTGLGLYLSRYMIELHGGWVQLESQKGQGTQVKVGLPYQDSVSTKLQ